MNIAIIEDERPILESITSIIKQYLPDINICGTAQNSQEAYSLFNSTQPDIALCDVNLGEHTIFDVLEKLENREFKIIFITAFEEYALKAIKLSAIDFLIKPVDPIELIESIKKAKIFIDKEIEQIKAQVLINNIKSLSKSIERIVLKTAESIFIVNVQDMLHLKADGSYTTFHLKDGRKILVSKLLREYDDLLSDQGFIRVHQSHLVNLDAIDRFEKAEGGFLVLKNGKEVPVSLRKKENVLSILSAL